MQFSYAITTPMLILFVYFLDLFRGIIAQPSPRVLVTAVPPVAHENTSVILNCDYKLPKGKQLLELTWKKDGWGILRLRRNGERRILKGTPISRKRIDLSYSPSSSLRLYEAKADDSGMYQCIVGYGDDIYGEAELNVIVPPQEPVISTNIGNDNIKEGDSLVLTCESDGGKPPANVTWWHNGKLLDDAVYTVEGDEYTKGVGSSKITLEISAEDDRSAYECRSWNMALRPENPKNAFIILKVSYAPRARFPQPSARVAEHSSFSITCILEGKPRYTDVQWIKDGVVFDYANETLSVKDVTRDMSGEFTCLGWNSVGWGPESDVFTLDVTYPPEVKMLYMGADLQSSVATEGDVLELVCDSDANPPSEYFRWTLNGKEIGEKSNSLRIQKLLKTDYGSYQCTASNEMGQGSSLPFFLDIEYKPEAKISAASPLLVMESESAFVTLACIIEANPLANDIKWYKDDKEFLDNVGETIELTDISRVDAGSYTCQASNLIGWGKVSEPFELRVQYPPGFMEVSPSSITVQEYDFLSREFSCSADGDPEPTYKWIKKDTNVVYSETNVLKLDEGPVMRIHAGLYTCVVSNPMGKASKDVSLIVQHSPECIVKDQTFNAALNEKVVLTCEMRSIPNPIEFEWRVGDQILEDHYDEGSMSQLSVKATGTGDFQDYMCRARNDIGWSIETCIIRFREKSPPQRPRQCKWEEGTSYIFIQCRKGNDGGFHQEFVLFVNDVEYMRSIQPIFNISVDPGTEYKLDILAVNDIGSSSSYPINAKTLEGKPKEDPVLSGGAMLGIIIVILVLLVIISAIIIIVVRKKKRKSKGNYNINGTDRKEPVNQNLLTTKSDDIEAGFLPADPAKDGEDKNKNTDKEKSKSDEFSNKENGPTSKMALTSAHNGKNKKVYLPQLEHANNPYLDHTSGSDTDSNRGEENPAMCDDDDDDELIVYADLDLPQCNSTPKPRPESSTDDDFNDNRPYSTIDFNKRVPVSPIPEVREDENANETSGTTESTCPPSSVSEEEYKQKNPHTVIV